MTRVALTGATGRLGREVAPLLAQQQDVELVLLVRDPHAARDLPGTPAHADLRSGRGVAEALAGADVLVLITPDVADLPALDATAVEAAAAVGVGHVVKVSAHSAAYHVSFGALHAAGEDVLARSGVPSTVLRPAMFTQSVGLTRQGRALLFPSRDGAAAFVDRRDVAAATAAAARARPGGVRTLTGPAALRFDEVAQLLTAATGRRHRHVSPPPWLVRRVLPLATDLDRFTADNVVALAEAIATGAQSTPTGDLEALLGRAPRAPQDHLGDLALQ